MDKILPSPPVVKHNVRARLENNIPGITRSLEFGYIEEIEYLSAPVTINRRGGGRGFLVFITYYFPEIFFGGYFAFFKFLAAIKENYGGELKLVIVKRATQKQHLEDNIERAKQNAPEVAKLFSDFHLLGESRTIDVNGDYGVISFCAETHFVASDAARQLSVRPIFFIQDYEPAFHPAGSINTFLRSALDLPHIGVFNTNKLYEYFRDFTDVGPVRDAAYQYAVFEEALKPMPWDLPTFRARHAAKERKHFIVYARPESLASRNELAIAILALKDFLRHGSIDESRWTFSGIGALTPQGPMELSPHSRIEFIPKLALEEYEEYLLQGDVGLSLISTAHPGMVHYQMANFGLTTVTYEGVGRTAEWLTAQNKNLVPSKMTIEGLCQGIARAIDLSADVDARYRNAVESTVRESANTVAAAAKKVLTARFQR